MILSRLMVLSAVVFWGWSFVATKIVLQFMTPLELAGMRMMLSLPMFLFLLYIKKIKISFSKSDYKLMAIGGVVLSAHFLVQITGLETASATNTGWIIAVTPALIAILAVIFLKEKLSKLQITGIMAATGGIILLVSKGSFSNLSWVSSKGDWLILMSAFTWAIYTTLTRDISRRHNPLAVTTVVISITSFIIISLMAKSADWSRMRELSLEAIIALLFLGIVCQAIAFWFWQEGVAKLGASRAGFFLYLEPLATTSLAVPYLNEKFGIYTLLGGLLLLFGVYLTEKRES